MAGCMPGQNDECPRSTPAYNTRPVAWADRIQRPGRSRASKRREPIPAGGGDRQQQADRLEIRTALSRPDWRRQPPPMLAAVRQLPRQSALQSLSGCHVRFFIIDFIVQGFHRQHDKSIAVAL